jgi:hypothetical protein
VPYVHPDLLNNMYALFNKDKKLVGYSEDFPDTPNLDIFKYEILEEQSNLMEWKWEGDMLNGKMVKKNLEKDKN